MADGTSRGKQLAAGLALLVAGIGIGNSMSDDADEEEEE